MTSPTWHPPMDVKFLRSSIDAWNDPETRRMTLVVLRSIVGNWNRREIAKALGVSIFVYQRYELGREIVSRETLEKAAAAMEVLPARLEWTLRLTDDMLMKLRDSWPKKWREDLEPLSAEERRALVLTDRDLHNWGLGDLLCTKSLEAEEPAEAVELAELAVLVMQQVDLPKDSCRRFEAYAWGHLGHALRRRGDLASAEGASAKAIELWKTGKGSDRDDQARAEKLAAIVPSFPAPEPVSHPRSARKPAKRASSV